MGQYIDCKPSRFLEEINKNFTQQSEIKLSKKGASKKPYKIFAKTKSAEKPTINIPNNLKKVSTAKSNVNPSNLENLQAGIKVKHNRFGRGKILKIEGENANKKATVFFEGIGQKMLLLKFAKLEIVN